MEPVLKLAMNMTGQVGLFVKPMMDKINANPNEKKVTLSTSQEIMGVGQQMRAKIRANQAKMEASQERMETAINAGQEKVEATISVTCPAWTKFEETINKPVGGVCQSTDLEPL
jgi:Asp/Glu/hydantoin racemase